MQYCAVCLIAKDEDYYLREWCEYHLRIGFDTLLVYDNGSQVPLRELLKDFIALGRVIVHDVPGEFRQSETYTTCIRDYRHAFKWIAFIDSDEFIFPKKTDNIKLFLAEYEEYGGVVANWINFGTSGILRRRDASQIFNFAMTDGEESSTIKSIVQPARVAEQGIHGATFLDGHYAVSSDHIPLHQDCYSSPFINDAIQINHYAFRTWEDYERKSSRWIGMDVWNRASTLEEEQAKYTRHSTDMIKFYSQLKDVEIGKPSALFDTLSVSDFTAMLLAVLSKPLDRKRLVEAQLLCCHAVLVFQDEPMVYYFRAILSRLAQNVQQSLRFIQTTLRLSGSSTIYYEYARILSALGEHEKARLAQKHADYKKYVEDTQCAPIVEDSARTCL